MAPAAGNPITTVLITQDAAPLVERCVRSCLPFSDEVLVVDGGSVDDTVAVAEALGCRVLVNPFPGYAAQRAFGAAQARNDWIFWIDTDEVVDAGLADELATFAAGAPSGAAGASMLRVNAFLGRWVIDGAELKVRLYHRGRASVTPTEVHEAVDCDGPVERLDGVLWHCSFHGMTDAVDRLNRYTTLEARAAPVRARGRGVRLVLRPAARFLQRYVGFRAYRLGWAGFVYAAHWAYWDLVREAKRLELDRPPPSIPGADAARRARIGPGQRRG